MLLLLGVEGVGFGLVGVPILDSGGRPVGLVGGVEGVGFLVHGGRGLLDEGAALGEGGSRIECSWRCALIVGVNGVVSLAEVLRGGALVRHGLAR